MNNNKKFVYGVPLLGIVLVVLTTGLSRITQIRYDVSESKQRMVHPKLEVHSKFCFLEDQEGRRIAT